MSRITKKNDKFIARVKASMDHEKKYRHERQQGKSEAKEVRNMHHERNMKISESNDRASELWIATTGISVPQIFSLILHGGDAGMLLNRLELRVYNEKNKATENINVITFIKMLHHQKFPDLCVSQRGQVTIGELVMPARIYIFIRYHWLISLAAASHNQYNLKTESVRPITVTTITTSEA